MDFVTRSNLRTRVYRLLFLVPGTSVQTYQEGFVDQAIQDAFDHLFKKRHWTHLTNVTSHTLDGSGGVITDAALTGVTDHTDVEWIRQSPYHPDDIIAYSPHPIQDENQRGWWELPWDDAQVAKVFQFSPASEATSIKIRARRKPTDFTDASTIPMDRIVMQHLATANVLAADGMNPEHQERQQALFEDRYNELINGTSAHILRTESTRFSSEFTVAE